MAALGYTRENLVPGEEIFHVGSFNWTYMLMALFHLVLWGGLAGFILFGTGKIPYQLPPTVLQYLPWVALALGLFGVLRFFFTILIMRTTEMVVTTTRIIYKRGIISRNVMEMNLDNIEGAEVRQSVLGRIFGYGTCHVRGTGEGDLVLPTDLDDPAVFRMKIREARQVMMDRRHAGSGTTA